MISDTDLPAEVSINKIDVPARTGRAYVLCES